MLSTNKGTSKQGRGFTPTHRCTSLVGRVSILSQVGTPAPRPTLRSDLFIFLGPGTSGVDPTRVLEPESLLPRPLLNSSTSLKSFTHCVRHEILLTLAHELNQNRNLINTESWAYIRKKKSNLLDCIHEIKNPLHITSSFFTEYLNTRTPTE